MAAISIKQLLEAGVHFGHQTRRWNPKMKPYIFGERNGIHIIDLQKTIRLFKQAVDHVSEAAAQGKTVLFVGTKSQAQEAVEEEARRCGMYYVNHRWLGGLLTNFMTVQNSIRRYRELDEMRANGFYEKLSKKEAARLERERRRLEKNLRGIRDMDRCPDVLFVIDSRQEAIAVAEAARLGITIVAVVDTNADPEVIDYVIPGNDDALRAVKLFAQTIADAVLAGRTIYEAKLEAERKEAEERAARQAAEREAARQAAEAAKAAAEAAAQAAAAAQEATQETPPSATAAVSQEAPAAAPPEKTPAEAQVPSAAAAPKKASAARKTAKASAASKTAKKSVRKKSTAKKSAAKKSATEKTTAAKTSARKKVAKKAAKKEPEKVIAAVTEGSPSQVSAEVES